MDKKEFDVKDLDDETTKHLETLMEIHGFETLEQVIKFLVNERINEGMMNMTGGAKARQVMGLYL
ncbi:hypothetical protein KZX29_04435 [Moraxella osloensis]|uniref:hypothetical protein n=1 Tax=Faucicola osloensis TaxID=34062 RepID=UPI002003545F|nr:hypothetical protein [Moraxella osloensis]MCK6158045.1 hypothetical protein [Moraxella osloensis]